MITAQAGGVVCVMAKDRDGLGVEVEPVDAAVVSADPQNARLGGRFIEGQDGAVRQPGRFGEVSPEAPGAKIHPVETDPGAYPEFIGSAVRLDERKHAVIR